jgi:hypothetical protein
VDKFTLTYGSVKRFTIAILADVRLQEDECSRNMTVIDIAYGAVVTDHVACNTWQKMRFP